jgi:hypothetical protein
MKPIIATSLRHAFTALAGLGGFLLARGAIGADDVQSVNAAGASLGDALSVIAAALVARLMVWLSGMIVTGGAPSVKSLSLCLCIGTLAVGGLPACSAYPVTASLSYQDARTGTAAALSSTFQPRGIVRGDK